MKRTPSGNTPPQPNDIEALRKVNLALVRGRYAYDNYEGLSRDADVTIYKIKRLVATLGLLSTMTNFFKVTKKGEEALRANP